MRAISSFNREAGMSTFWCRAWSAFRTRVSMSATGSVNLIVCFSSSHPFAPRHAENLRQLIYYPHLSSRGRGSCGRGIGARRANRPCPLRTTKSRLWRASLPLPRRLRNPRNLPAQRELAEAQAANAELAHVSARTPAELAAVVLPRGKLRLRQLVVARRRKLLFDLCVLHSFCGSHEILK